MFKIKNVFLKTGIEIEISYDGQKVICPMKMVMNKKNKDGLADEIQFGLLEEYLNYKGKEFKSTLMKSVVEAEQLIFKTITRKSVYPLPQKAIDGILDIMNYEDVLGWLSNVRKLPMPPQLDDVFDINIEKSKLKTRIQTYTKDDYRELMALIICLKTVYGPILIFGNIKSHEIAGHHAESDLMGFILNNPISKTAPFKKLQGSTEMIVNNTLKSSVEVAVKIIEKSVSSDAIPEWILGIALFKRIMAAPIEGPHDTPIIVTSIHNFNLGKLSPEGNTSNAVKEKRPHRDDTGEEESVMESYKIATDLPVALSEEFNNCLRDVDYLVDVLSENVPIDNRVVMDALSFTRPLEHNRILDIQKYLLSIIFKDVIDPRSIDHVNLNSIMNMFAVGFAYLWANDQKDLAVILTSYALLEDEEESMQVSLTSNITRISQDRKDMLDKLFPYKRIKIKRTSQEEENNALISIDLLANDIYKTHWHHCAADKYLIEVLGKVDRRHEVSENLKNILADLFIFANK